MRIDDDIRWNAVLRRDRAFDGRFVTGVLTTGIYCRPSCAARHPARANVRFFASGAEARDAGLRACKRCLPDDVTRDEAAVAAAIDEIKASEGKPTLGELAVLTGYSASHFQRVFKRATGLSPSAYARALREERAKDALGGSARVSDAIYDAGYEAPSRFYDDTKGKLGMSASEWRDGGKGRTIHWTVVDTSLGAMLVAATETGVCCLSFDEGEDELRARFPNADLVEGGEAFRDLFERVTDDSAKWALLAPVLVPMLMLLGISPEMGTAAYRVGDGATNIITPLMPYFPLILVFCQRWQKDFGLGSLAATMLPYSMLLLASGLVMTVLWVLVDLPLGPSAPIGFELMAPNSP